MGMAFPYAMGKATVSNQKMKEFPCITETFAKKIPGIANQNHGQVSGSDGKNYT
jgi:hypothetical protein